MTAWSNALLCLALAASSAAADASAASKTAAAAEPGFLVAAPDRGFLGNEETRDAFEAFAGGRNAQLVFVTDERTAKSVGAGVARLKEQGARRLVVLPFFLSRSDPGYRRLRTITPQHSAGLAVTWARSYGESYLAVEALADRFRELPDRGGRRVVVVGTGAADEASRKAMSADWQRIADGAADGVGFESVRVVLEASRGAVPTALRAALDGAERPAVVPFHLGGKLDGMMSFSAFVRGAAAGAHVSDGDVTPHATVAQWMAREANRHAPVRPEDVGVVALAHGSDFHWNETMLQALVPLAQRFKLEPAFSMADPPVIERAVRRLESRGARVILILRIFGLAASFRDSVERLIGLDVEEGGQPAATQAHAAHGHDGHAGHSGGSAIPAPRIRSTAVLATAGGLDDHPLFAEALLERARSLSRDPARETVIVVAHGDGDDARDARWNELLQSLAARMRARGGDRFRAIHTATWREDWPEKRRPAVERVRALVQKASADGGRTLVVPARTLGQGPERRLLDGLAFELGEGFAPHPLFARWAGEQVEAAVAGLVGESTQHAAATGGTSAIPR
jgi:hypothetical protein